MIINDSELARARVKGREKFKDAPKLFFNLSDLRFATSDSVADYRAKRLKCPIIIDLCSGVGMQSIAFARECGKVISVEIDSRKVEYARRNAAVYGLENIEFICGDAVSLDVVKRISKADIVFCDPERLAAENERRIENIAIIKEILNKYSQLTKNIGIEVPPQLSPERISFDCEREYLSVDGKLNRLTLYFGMLKRYDVSAVSLPSEERIFKGEKKKLEESENALKYLYDVDKAVLKAGLVEELAFNLDADVFIFKRTKKNLFLTSDSNISNVFLTGFLVLSNVANNDFEIIEALKKLNAKEIILRTEIQPDEYWNVRNKYQNELTGTERVHLFLFDNCALICRKL